MICKKYKYLFQFAQTPSNSRHCRYRIIQVHRIGFVYKIEQNLPNPGPRHGLVVYGRLLEEVGINLSVPNQEVFLLSPDHWDVIKFYRTKQETLTDNLAHLI